ncbi:MAG: ABC transporter ATP-binding protein [Caldilineaceae bacterium]|nr:ABC transporter ATP-binding protein [Caldilineaceae bacterium]
MDLRLDQLRHTYTAPDLAARTVLDIETWQVPSGDQVLLRGISGSGKTTLLNVLAGLLRPTAGTVWLGERSLYALSEVERDRLRAATIGYVFQMHHLVPTLSALENVEMPLVFGRSVPGHQRRARALEVLDRVGLVNYARYRPVQLSTGQRLRVAVARALASGPMLVLADEPTAALDMASAHMVMDLLQEECRERGATLIVASHDPSMNARFSHVVDLSNGVLVEAGA